MLPAPYNGVGGQETTLWALGTGTGDPPENPPVVATSCQARNKSAAQTGILLKGVFLICDYLCPDNRV